MAILPLLQKQIQFPIPIRQSRKSIQSRKITQMALKRNNSITKRAALKMVAAAGAALAVVLAKEAICSDQKIAIAFDIRMTVPEQTLEEAENGIKGHAQSLLQVKILLEAESWKAAQKALRKSSAYLKQDIYTVIQAKPASQRSELRKLYSNLFNSVTRLDYAARDEDLPRIWEAFDNIVLALNNILSRL